MKSKWIIVVIALLALLAVCAAAAAIGAVFFLSPVRVGGIQFGSAQVLNVQAEATEEQSFPVEGLAVLDLENVFGNVRITAAPNDTQKEIQVTARKVAWGADQPAAEAALDGIKVTMTQAGDRLTVRVDSPVLSSRIQDNYRADQVDFTIVVPVETTVLAHTHSGEVSLAGTQGPADLASDFGAIDASAITGKLKMSSNSGSITARDIQAGEASIELTSKFGAISLENAAALDVNATTNSGAVELVNLQASGPVTAHSSFGDIRLTRAYGASYDLSTDSGSVDVDGARGSLKATSGFGSVEVTHGEQATIDLETKSGKVSYQGSLGEGPHRLNSDFGSIHLALPGESAFAFDLETRFGSIDSDFPLTIESQPDENHWLGTVNGGSVSLNASTRSGSITLEQVSQ